MKHKFSALSINVLIFFQTIRCYSLHSSISNISSTNISSSKRMSSSGKSVSSKAVSSIGSDSLHRIPPGRKVLLLMIKNPPFVSYLMCSALS